jgi:hypothetical protein
MNTKFNSKIFSKKGNIYLNYENQIKIKFSNCKLFDFSNISRFFQYNENKNFLKLWN